VNVFTAVASCGQGRQPFLQGKYLEAAGVGGGHRIPGGRRSTHQRGDDLLRWVT